MSLLTLTKAMRRYTVQTYRRSRKNWKRRLKKRWGMPTLRHLLISYQVKDCLVIRARIHRQISTITRIVSRQWVTGITIGLICTPLRLLTIHTPIECKLILSTHFSLTSRNVGCQAFPTPRRHPRLTIYKWKGQKLQPKIPAKRLLSKNPYLARRVKALKTAESSTWRKMTTPLPIYLTKHLSLKRGTITQILTFHLGALTAKKLILGLVHNFSQMYLTLIIWTFTTRWEWMNKLRTFLFIIII